MKNITLFLILMIAIFVGACGNDDDRICVKSDFIGDFVGATECTTNQGTGAPVATVIRVTDTNMENVVNVQVDNFRLDVTIDNCNFSGTDQNADVDITLTGSLSGDKLKVKLEGVAFNFPLDCESEGERN